MNTLVELFNSLTPETKIGVAVAIAAVAVVSKLALNKKPRPPALDPQVFKKFKLREKKHISHNSRIYRFDLHDPEDIIGLPIGQHMSVKAVIDGKEVLRSYTPVSSDDNKGYFDLLIKVYDKGLMSQYIEQLKPGDTLDVRGPKGRFLYKPNMVQNIGMLAGGTGITPMLQVTRAILKNPSDTTKINLIFANVNEDDILLREELDELVKKHPNFKVFYVLNNPPANWTGGVGFVSADMIKANFAPATDDVKVVMCGPPMMNKAMTGHLQTLGYNIDEQTFMF